MPLVWLKNKCATNIWTDKKWSEYKGGNVFEVKFYCMTYVPETIKKCFQVASNILIIHTLSTCIWLCFKFKELCA